jgi:cell division protein FtsI (penicillin-binding protein 3)
MIKKSRLRTQKKKGGRRVILYLLTFLVLGAVGYQLDQNYGITSSIKEVLHNIKNTFSLNGPVRGTFYDRNLKQLAVTLERVSVYARTREIESIQETAAQLSQVFDLEKDTLEERLKSGGLRHWIAKDINQEQEASLKSLQLPGVYLQRDNKRYYPNDFQAAHIIGYVENGIGLSGVEFYYDRLLAGKKLEKLEETQPLSDSLDLVLSLDLKIQSILDDIVKDVAQIEQAEKVTAYLLESGTGEIIGGANLPGFNPNIFTRYSQEQTENMFLVPLYVPAKMRLFLRDAIMLHTQEMGDISPSAWSLVPDKSDLGGKLRFWEWLGLEDLSETDFYVPSQSGKTEESRQKPVVVSKTNFGVVPEFATPLSLLATYSVLLNNGKKIHPFVVKKILDKETGVETLLTGSEESGIQSKGWSDAEDERIESLFRSQATQGASGTYYFRDEVLVSVEGNGPRHFLINDLLFVTIPAGTNDLNMLIVIQRPPQGVLRDASEAEDSVEKIIEEKAVRLSVLQLIAKSVADVVEPEIGDGDNYQAKTLSVESSGKAKTAEIERITLGTMPDLKGLSLRKSLRLLQGINLELDIQGTGKVVDQKPSPGTSLKGITECVLILNEQVTVTPGKL